MRVLILLLVVLVVTGENKVNSYSDQLKLGQVCKFGVEFDKISIQKQIVYDIGPVTPARCLL